MLKILLMQTKLRFHTIEYFCFYLNNQLLLFADHETTSSPFGVSITTESELSEFQSHDSHLAARIHLSCNLSSQLSFGVRAPIGIHVSRYTLAFFLANYLLVCA